MTHPFIPFLNVARLETVYTLFGQTVENVYHFKHISGAIAPTDMTTLAAGMKNWFTTALASQISDDLTLIMIRVRDLTEETSPRIEYVTGMPVTGSGTGGSAPGNVTLAVKWTTGLGGRSYRGRSFVPGVLKAKLEGDSVNAAWASNLLSCFQNLLTAPLTGWDLVVASQFHAGAWRTTGVATEITGVSLNRDIDSQRRRLIGRGS